MTVTKVKGIVAQDNAGAIEFTEVAGITPLKTTEGMFINNPAPTNMTNILLPPTVTDSKVVCLAANGNTTMNHGLGLLLKGAVNVVIPANGIIAFVKFSAQSPAWIEQYRNF